MYYFQPPLEDLWEDSHSRKSPPDSEKKESKTEVSNMPIPDVHSVGGVLVHMPHVCSVRKIATNDTYNMSINILGALIYCPSFIYYYPLFLPPTSTSIFIDSYILKYIDYNWSHLNTIVTFFFFPFTPSFYVVFVVVLDVAMLLLLLVLLSLLYCLLLQIMTATVETVSEQLDLTAIIPAEKVVSAVARAITLSSESDYVYGNINKEYGATFDSKLK